MRLEQRHEECKLVATDARRSISGGEGSGITAVAFAAAGTVAICTVSEPLWHSQLWLCPAA